MFWIYLFIERVRGGEREGRHRLKFVFYICFLYIDREGEREIGIG